jgi:hypothetical protein
MTNGIVENQSVLNITTWSISVIERAVEVEIP